MQKSLRQVCVGVSVKLKTISLKAPLGCYDSYCEPFTQTP